MLEDFMVRKKRKSLNQRQIRQCPKRKLSSKEKAASKETKSSWNTDVDIDTSNFEKAVDTAVEFEPVLAEEVLEQAGFSVKLRTRRVQLNIRVLQKSTGIKPSVSSNQSVIFWSQSMSKHWSFRQNRRMLAANAKSGKQESGKDELIKPIPINASKMANLKTAYRSRWFNGWTSPEEDLRWDIPGPFDYISSNPNKTGHPVGTTFCGHYKALLTGKMKAKETLSEAFADVDMDESGYIDLSEMIPEHFIVYEQGFEHPLTFKDAVENRIEFMTEDDSEITNLNELFDTYICLICGLYRDGMNSSRKTWVIDSVNLEGHHSHRFRQVP